MSLGFDLDNKWVAALVTCDSERPFNSCGGRFTSNRFIRDDDEYSPYRYLSLLLFHSWRQREVLPARGEAGEVLPGAREFTLRFSWRKNLYEVLELQRDRY